MVGNLIRSLINSTNLAAFGSKKNEINTAGDEKDTIGIEIHTAGDKNIAIETGMPAIGIVCRKVRPGRGPTC